VYLENFSGRGETDGRAEKAGRIGRAGASVGVWRPIFSNYILLIVK
jgi:hypothetical protein